MTRAAQTHEIRNLRSQRVVDALERHDVIHVVGRSVIAILTNRMLLAIQLADLHPLPVIATLNAIAAALFELLLSFC